MGGGGNIYCDGNTTNTINTYYGVSLADIRTNTHCDENTHCGKKCSFTTNTHLLIFTHCDVLFANIRIDAYYDGNTHCDENTTNTHLLICSFLLIFTHYDVSTSP